VPLIGIGNGTTYDVAHAINLAKTTYCVTCGSTFLVESVKSSVSLDFKTRPQDLT